MTIRAKIQLIIQNSGRIDLFPQVFTEISATLMYIIFQAGEESPPKLSPRTTNEEELNPPPIPPKKLLQESGV